MIIKKYDYLHSDVVFIRTEVFVKEQEFEEEFDGIDSECTFFVMYDGDKPVATCRYFVCEDDSEGYHIGRIAVMKEYRDKGLGSEIVRAAENEIKKIGGKYATLGAQMRAKGFYEKIGYTAYGEEYYEEYCLHINMKKDLA